MKFKFSKIVGEYGGGCAGFNGFVSHRGYVLVFFGLWFENGFGWCFVADGSRGTVPDRDKWR